MSAQNAPSLQHLVSLSLYDCQIKSLNGIGMLAAPTDDREMCCPNLVELNVGRNPLTTLPDELSRLPLKELWCDDCQLTGAVPECVWKLTDLETLRISNNHLTHISPEIQNLKQLTTLCLDGNDIESLPSELSKLCNLKSLLLRYVLDIILTCTAAAQNTHILTHVIRNNKIRALPGISSMQGLSLLHVSSNQLESLSVEGCTSLEYLYANSNHLTAVPTGMADLALLKRATLSHNQIASLSPEFVDRFGEACDKCEKVRACD